MNRYAAVITLLCLTWPGSAMAESAASPAPALDALILEARENNPAIREARAQWQAAEHAVVRAGSLDDPVASYGFFIEEVQTRVGPQEQKAGLSQRLPFPGKLDLKAKAQEKKARMLEQAYEAAVREVIKDVKFAFHDLAWIDKAIAIADEEKEILEKFENTAQRRYESNLAGQQDVIKAQVELSRIIEKQVLLNQNRRSLSVRLNRLLNRPENTAIGPVEDLPLKEFTYTLDEITRRSERSRQELIAADLSVEKSQAEKSLAALDFLPDFNLGAEYIEIGDGQTLSPNDGEDAWMGMVSVNVPIWYGKLNAGLREKESQLDAAVAGREAVRNRVAFEANDLFFKITSYREILLLYETALLPQAEQAFESTQSGFETGEVTFLDWLDTERTYLKTRLGYYKTVNDYHKALAELERAMGESLNAGEDADE